MGTCFVCGESLGFLKGKKSEGKPLCQDCYVVINRQQTIDEYLAEVKKKEREMDSHFDEYRADLSQLAAAAERVRSSQEEANRQIRRDFEQSMMDWCKEYKRSDNYHIISVCLNATIEGLSGAIVMAKWNGLDVLAKIENEISDLDKYYASLLALYGINDSLGFLFKASTGLELRATSEILRRLRENRHRLIMATGHSDRFQEWTDLNIADKILHWRENNLSPFLIGTQVFIAESQRIDPSNRLAREGFFECCKSINVAWIVARSSG